MRRSYVETFALVLAASLFAGCGDDSTEPEPPTTQDRHLWSKRFGDAENQSPTAIAIDASGNVVVTGAFEGSVDFGGGPLTSGGGYDAFVAKFAPDGSHLWSKRFGFAGDQSPAGVAIDASGNVVVTGKYYGTVNFGGDSLVSAGSNDIFVAKFDRDGSHLWSKRFGDDLDQGGTSVATDAEENIVICGEFKGTVDFGGGTLTSAGNWDVFVVKFASDGSHLWSKAFGDPSSQWANSIATDAVGNVVVAGYFFGTVDLGGGALTSAGFCDVFVAKFASDGSHLWSKRFGDSWSQLPEGVAVDKAGNVVVTGEFMGTADFGGGTLRSAGFYDIFVAKFAPDGSHLWNKGFGDAHDQFPDCVATDAAGNSFVAGHFFSSVDFGGDTLTSAGFNDIFAVKLAPDGSHLWSERFGDPDHQFAAGVDVDAAGNVIVVGPFRGNLDFGGGTLTSAGGEDIFVVKFGP